LVVTLALGAGMAPVRLLANGIIIRKH